MKRTSSIAAISLIIFIIGGCTHTELTRRYKSKNYAKAEKTYVEVSAFVMTPPPPSQQTLLSQVTTPEGQAALISKMSKWAKSPEELYKALVVSKKGPEGSGGNIDKTVFTKRVVFSVERIPPGKGPDDLTPADRISSLKVTLKLPQKVAEENQLREAQKKYKEEGKGKPPLGITDPIFEDCNKFENEYGTMDFGTLKRTQVGKAQGTLEVGPAIDVKVPVKGSATASRETTIDEEIHLSQRYIKMVGAIKDKKKTAVISQESQVGYDLTGNFSVDFTIRIDNHNHSGFVILTALENDDTAPKTEKAKKDGKAAKAEKVRKDSKKSKLQEFKIDFGSLIYPVNSQAVHCDLTGDYIIRHVRQLPLYDRYDRELAEGLHRVVFVNGSSKKADVELIRKQELRTIIYQIVLDEDANHPLYLGRPVNDPLKEDVKDPTEPKDKNPLRFIKLDDAKKFLSWLRASNSALKNSQSIKAANYKIYTYDRNDIKKGDIERLHIRAKQLNR
jgi:hypothetical protein